MLRCGGEGGYGQHLLLEEKLLRKKLLLELLLLKLGHCHSLSLCRHHQSM